MRKAFSIRPAVETDFLAIRGLIRQARINPTGLDWRRFIVVVNGSRLVACGQLKPVAGGLTELASLAVLPVFRRQGIGSALIKQLLQVAPRPLYLTCRSGLGEFYERFGFISIAPPALPPYYRRLHRLASLVMGLARHRESLLIMKLG